MNIQRDSRHLPVHHGSTPLFNVRNHTTRRMGLSAISMENADSQACTVYTWVLPRNPPLNVAPLHYTMGSPMFPPTLNTSALFLRLHAFDDGDIPLKKCASTIFHFKLQQIYLQSQSFVVTRRRQSRTYFATGLETVTPCFFESISRTLS